MGYSTSLGLEFVSTMATTGIFNFLASATAIFSRWISTTYSTEGNLFISFIPEKNLFNLPLSASNFCDSLFV